MTLDQLKTTARKVVPAAIALSYKASEDGYYHVFLTDDAEAPTMSVSVPFHPDDEPATVQPALVDAIIRYTKLQEERAFAAGVVA